MPLLTTYTLRLHLLHILLKLTFLTIYPPLLLNVVCEQPLRVVEFKSVCYISYLHLVLCLFFDEIYKVKKIKLHIGIKQVFVFFVKVSNLVLCEFKKKRKKKDQTAVIHLCIKNSIHSFQFLVKRRPYPFVENDADIQDTSPFILHPKPNI